jgi:hypothetical protein
MEFKDATDILIWIFNNSEKVNDQSRQLNMLQTYYCR